MLPDLEFPKKRKACRPINAMNECIIVHPMQECIFIPFKPSLINRPVHSPSTHRYESLALKDFRNRSVQASE